MKRLASIKFNAPKLKSFHVFNVHHLKLEGIALNEAAEQNARNPFVNRHRHRHRHRRQWRVSVVDSIRWTICDSVLVFHRIEYWIIYKLWNSIGSRASLWISLNAELTHLTCRSWAQLLRLCLFLRLRYTSDLCAPQYNTRWAHNAKLNLNFIAN